MSACTLFRVPPTVKTPSNGALRLRSNYCGGEKIGLIGLDRPQE